MRSVWTWGTGHQLEEPLPSQGNTVTLTEEVTVIETDSTVDEDAAKKEFIRQAMSELGKRSAAKRRKKLTNTFGILT